MIKFVIVDDDIDMQEAVKKVIRKSIFNHENEVKIEKYSKITKDLQKEIMDVSCPKIYILDIELENNHSGIQVAKMIRDNDWESQIIFMTNHDKMFETVYRSVYQVFDFIEKFHDFSNRLEKDIKIILKKKCDNKIFKYSSRNIDLQVYLKCILYIYRDTSERKVVLVTDQNQFTIGLGVQEILGRLDERFKMVHRACIVNTERVQKYDWSKKNFVLDNGETIHMLSKKYKKDVE